MTIGRASFIGLRTAILALCLLWAASLNAEYPEKPVEYVIPFGAGGESGVTARLQQPVFQKLTKQDLVIKYQIINLTIQKLFGETIIFLDPKNKKFDF